MNLKPLKHLITLIFAVVTLSCASSSSIKNTETMAIAAGFKAIKPTNPNQEKILRNLPANKISLITKDGKNYYLLPDRADGQAYIGGSQQYQNYLENGQAQAAVSNYRDSTTYKAIDADTYAADQWNLSGWQGWGESEGWFTKN